MPVKSSSTEKPKNWPAQIKYLIVPSYSSTLTAADFSTLRTKPDNAIENPSNVTRGPCKLVKIKDIQDPAHPACGQSGLFATKDLKPGSFLLEYLGEIHASIDSASHNEQQVPSLVVDDHAHSDYDLSLDREASLAIDADKMGNEARFVNDYRGIKTRPNAEFKEVWDPRRKERAMAVWVVPEGKSGKGTGIRKGDEIVISYGRGFWGARKMEEDIEGI